MEAFNSILEMLVPDGLVIMTVIKYIENLKTENKQVEAENEYNRKLKEFLKTQIEVGEIKKLRDTTFLLYEDSGLGLANLEEVHLKCLVFQKTNGSLSDC